MLRPEHWHTLSSQYGLRRPSVPQPFSGQLYLRDAAGIFGADTLAIYPVLALAVPQTNRVSPDPAAWCLTDLADHSLAVSGATSLNFASGRR
jgi:hypothetical protein